MIINALRWTTAAAVLLFLCGCPPHEANQAERTQPQNVDSDNDGVPDDVDGCPYDSAKTDPGPCGCGQRDTDSDGDGVPDCQDACPADPDKTAPGLCGCGQPDTDSDGDGVPDCQDACPADPNKTAPGACGCGQPETDSDGDGVPDCIDNCPNQPNPDQADRDADGLGDACSPRKLALVLDSSLERDVTTPDPELPVSGWVLVLDGGPMPGQVNWRRDVAGAPEQNGALPTAGDGRWTGTIPLLPADNHLIFTLSDTNISESLTATRNPGYAFGGQLALSPDVVYLSESRTITATIALTDPKTNPDGVILVRLASGAEIQVANLRDDGDLSNGDEIQGDGIFSGRFDLAEPSAGMISLRAVVTLLGSTDQARSEVFGLLATEHFASEQLAQILTKQAEYQSQIDQAAGTGDLPATIAAIIAALSSDPDVADVGPAEGGRGVWVVYKSGIAGVIHTPEPGTKGGALAEPVAAAPRGATGRTVAYPPYGHYYKTHATPQLAHRVLPANVGASSPSNEIKSNKVIAIAAQYWDWGANDDVPAIETTLQNHGCYTVNSIHYTSSGGGSVEDFKSLGNYGIVLVSSHGDSFYKGILSLWKDCFGWGGPFGQVVLHSNMAVTDDNKVTYEDDLKRGRLVIWAGSYGIMPSFIRTYAGAMPNSLVYLSCCRGAWNGTMAEAFLSQGAGSYLSYSDYVAVSFCVAHGPPLFTDLLVPGHTLADAFVPGQVETDNDPAEFMLFGAGDLSIQLQGLNDGGFESNSITQAWSVDGDARIIPQLGDALPTEGQYMGIISTGLGYTTTTGTLTQEFCLSDAAAQISFDWNFFSEEFMEWVGSIFQDSFTVTLEIVDQPGSAVTLLHRAIDDLAGQVSPVSIGFDQGDVYATGWLSFSAAVPESFQGKRVRLTFFATDIGDSIYDTAVLIDNIQITDE